MQGLRDERLDCTKKLLITIRGDLNEDAPVFGDWERFQDLVDDLGEVDRHCIIVVAKSGSHHVQHLFTPEENGTT